MTIYDIAKEAGVSASSVSRVLNNKPGVNAKKRKLVLDILQAHNYSPNVISRETVSESLKMIGVLVEDIRAIHHADSAYYLERELSKKGYGCIILNTGEDIHGKVQAIKQLEERHVKGAVLIGSSFQTPEVERGIEKHLSNVPIIMINAYLQIPNVYSVLSDEKNGVEKCVKFLAARGHTRLAFVREARTPSSYRKEQGFINGMILLHPGKTFYWTYEAGRTLQDGYDITRRIIEEHPDVEGIIYGIDILAAGGVRALFDMGVEVPKKVGIIGIDNSIYGEICVPKITSLDNKMIESSIMAAHALMDQLEGRANAIDSVIVPSKIVERETT